jgi:hypothetical protein
MRWDGGEFGGFVRLSSFVRFAKKQVQKISVEVAPEIFRLDETAQTATMAPSGDAMQRSFRKALADSHVAAIVLALLLFWPTQAVLQAMRGPFIRAVTFAVTMIAIRDVPSMSPGLNTIDRLMLAAFVSTLCRAVLSFAAAAILSRWVYGTSPLYVLRIYCSQLARRTNV